MLLFNPEKYLFFKLRPDGNITLWSEIKQAPRAYLSEAPSSPSLDRNFILRQSLWMPEIRSSDFNGDGRSDLVVTWMDELTVYLQGADSLFPAEPSFKYFFNLMDERERAGERAVVHAKVTDLQGDGMTDLVLSKVEGGITNVKSKILVYINKNGELKPASPDRVIADVDERSVIIVPSIRMGVLSYINMFISRQVNVTFAFYLMNEENSYPGKPDFKRQLRFSIDLKEGDIVGAMPRLNGDFDGDGRKDVV